MQKSNGEKNTKPSVPEHCNHNMAHARNSNISDYSVHDTRMDSCERKRKGLVYFVIHIMSSMLKCLIKCFM